MAIVRNSRSSKCVTVANSCALVFVVFYLLAVPDRGYGDGGVVYRDFKVWPGVTRASNLFSPSLCGRKISCSCNFDACYDGGDAPTMYFLGLLTGGVPYPKRDVRGGGGGLSDARHGGGALIIYFLGLLT